MTKHSDYRDYLSRPGALVIIGHPGNLSIECENCSVTGMSAHGEEGATIQAIARELNVPIVDLRPCDFWAVYDLTVKGPMNANSDRDLRNTMFPPGSPFSYIPTAQWLAAREAIGARVFWGRIGRQGANV